MAWWYCYLPLHLAGSGGNTLVRKVQATEQEIRAAYGNCARINLDGLGISGTVHFYKRPSV